MSSRLAELAALESFTWTVEDLTDPERILADTHAAYAGEIAALRAEYALGVAPERVSFEFGTDGSLWVRTDLRSDARRAAVQTDPKLVSFPFRAAVGMEAVERALRTRRAGQRSLAWLAKEIGVTRACVHRWTIAGIPDRWVDRVSKVANVPASTLRKV